jgi:ATP phosphoribosyltransferase
MAVIETAAVNMPLASSPTARVAASRLVMALPKGRILDELAPLLGRAGIAAAPDLMDEGSRRLRFETGDPGLDVVRVRAFDAATFVAFGACQLGVAGADVLMEFDYPEVYAPLDLGIGHCRLALAQPAHAPAPDLERTSHVRVATKYPNVARRYFAARGVQAEVVHLNGAMELAPSLGLSPMILDLVQTGSTLKANGLVEIATVAQVSSRLIVNRAALKTDAGRIARLIERIRDATL